MSDKRWAPLFPGIVPALLAAGLIGASPVAAQQEPSSAVCVTCHLDQEDERLSRPAELYPGDVHAEAGFGCVDCHGADLEPDPNAGFLSKPARRQIPGMCGRCHSDAAFMRAYDPGLRVDQVAEYRTSVHGRLLFEENDPGVATCVGCHPAHATLPPSAPESSVYPLNVAQTCAACHSDTDIMAGRGLATDQPEAYASSVHGKLMIEEGDLSAPTCNDCHGNHGAAPPGVDAVRNVCGQCHAMMADLFGESDHAERFSRGGRAGCATCHGHHAIEATDDRMLVTWTGSVCRSCHPAPDPAGDEFLDMKLLVDSLQREAARGRALLLEAEDAGMEVSQALFELEDVGNALTKSRTTVHTLRAERVAEEIDEGLAVTDRAMARGREALEEHRFRRIGLGASSAIILFLVLGLALKIRQIEARGRPSIPSAR